MQVIFCFFVLRTNVISSTILFTSACPCGDLMYKGVIYMTAQLGPLAIGSFIHQ